MINTDSKFFSVLEAEHKIQFDWTKNNCGLFVARVYKQITGYDYESLFVGNYNDKYSAFDYIKQKGGYEKILTDLGFSKRSNNIIHTGDIVICQNAIGIYDGNKGLFAGGVFRQRNRIKAAYFI